MTKRLAAFLSCLTLACAFAAGASGASAAERHPEIRKAINALERAKTDLQNAAHDYCGHRAEALAATDNALHQLRLALESDRASLNEPPSNASAFAFETAAYTTPAAEERHPNIRAAIDALEHAKTDLENAAHDYHGHRVEALEAVNHALEQLHLALDCDRR